MTDFPDVSILIGMTDRQIPVFAGIYRKIRLRSCCPLGVFQPHMLPMAGRFGIAAANAATLCHSCPKA